MTERTTSPTPRAPHALTLGAALLALHAVTVSPFAWEDVPWPRAWLRPSADLVVMLSVVCVLTLGVGARRRIAHGLACGALLMPLYRFGETLLPAFLHKEFEPWVDLQLLPGLLSLVTQELGMVARWLAALGGIVAVALLYALLVRVCATVVRGVDRPRVAVGVLAGCQTVAAAAFLLAPTVVAEGPSLWRRSMLGAIVDDAAQYLRGGRFWLADEVEDEIAAVAARLDRTPPDLGVLDDVDVYFLIVESYGRSVLSGQVPETYRDWLRDFALGLREAGFGARAAWLRPSVRGGGSWMAHAELVTGVRVPDQSVFELLLASDARALPWLLRERGHHTISVQPALPIEAWPEGEIFGFETEVFQPALPYRGHHYHWGQMPDQYALAYLLEHVVRPATRPLLVEYVGVTSHAPFKKVPPFYTDWTAALAPGAFAGRPALEYDIDWASLATHPQVREAYLASVHYSLRACFGFVALLQRPSLVFVLGDHQPPLSAPELGAQARDVPIHALSNQPALLERLATAGFREGLEPDPTLDAFPGAEFIFRFLRAFGAPPGSDANDGDGR
ncbi:MAG: hypothetical protein AAF628_04340 [Planctomycetota bacterium]